MINQEIYSVISSDETAMEALQDIRNCQPPKDRMHFFEMALEGSSEANAILLQKLYNDVISKSNIDYGTIPDSKGNLLKYKGYPLIEQSIDKINRLYEGIANEDVKLLNSLHDMIISSKKDFEFGFTYDIELLKITYNTAVMSLHEMISLCVFEYAQGLRNKAGVEFNFATTKKQNLLIVKNTKSLVKAYEKGQMKKVVNAFKKDPNMLNTAPASEASVTAAIGVAKTVFAAVPTFIKIPIGVIAALILLLILIRNAIYLFYSGSVSVRDYANTEKELVDFYIEKEKENGESSKVIEKHSKFSQKLQNIANFIEVKILNNDKQAKENLEVSNKENFGKSEVPGSPFSGDIVF